MDSDLRLNLKKYFKNHAMLVLDLDGLYSKFNGLTPYLYTSPNVVCLDLSGTIPYTFSGFTFKAPVMIKVPRDYPFNPPTVFVVPSETIKIVKNHPNVSATGVVDLKYLNSWNHTSKLVHLVEAMQQAFNIMSPIYSNSPKDVLSEKTKVLHFSEQAIPDSLFKKYNLSDRDRNLVEHAHRNIMTNLKDNRQKVVKQYNYDMNKYELHRKLMTNWAFALLELNDHILKLDLIERKIASELRADDLEKVEEMRDEVGEFVKSATSSKQIISSIEDGDFKVDDVLKFEDSDSSRLAELIVTQASCADMLEFLHECHGKKRISTKLYVQEMRRLSHDMFKSKLQREGLTR